MSKLLKNTRNTLSISYAVDKENQSGKFLLKLLKDNLPVKVDSDARILVSRKEDSEQFEWKDPIYSDGQIFLDAQKFDGIKQAGTYFIRVILKTGEIFPSSGKCVLKLQKNIKSAPGEFQIIQGINGKDGETQSLADIKILVKDAVSKIPLIKGDKGDKGEPGSKGDTGKGIKNVKYNDGDLFIYYTDGSNDAVSLPLLKGDTGKAGLGIKNITLVGTTLSVVMDDGTSHQLALPLLKGDPGEKGQDGANVSEITVSGNTLFFHYTDGLTYSAQLPLLKGDPGEKGQDAPKISDISLNGNTLTFILSDKSTYSVILPLLKGDTGNSGKSAYEIAEQYGFKGTVQEWLQSLKGIKGEKGEAGQNGKDAPTISNVTFSNNSLTFNLSDGSKKSVTIPTIQGPAGENGKDGKDAAKITGAKFNADQTQIIFSLDDGTSFTTNFIPPKNGTNGTNGKDAANFTNVEYSNNSLIFTLSDGKTITATLPDLKGKDGTNGKDGTPGKDAPTITKAEVTNNNLIFTLSDGKSVTAALPNLKGQDGKDAPTITKAEVKDKQLVFTLSDNSTVTVDISSLIKPDMTTSSDTAGSTVITGTSVQMKPSNTSVINASLSEQMPVLRLNYKYEPLSLVYDKEYNDLTLRGDTSGNVQSYRIDFSDIYDSLNNKLDNIIFTPNNQTVVLKPNSNQNDALVKFNVQKNKNGKVTNEEISTKLNIDTTQLGGSSAVKFYDCYDSNTKKFIDPTGGNQNYLKVSNYFIFQAGEYSYRTYKYNNEKWYLICNISPFVKNGTIFLPNDTDFIANYSINISYDIINNSIYPYTIDNNSSFRIDADRYTYSDLPHVDIYKPHVFIKSNTLIVPIEKDYNVTIDRLNNKLDQSNNRIYKYVFPMMAYVS